MTRNVAVEHIDDGACIITGRHSQLDYHEPGDFRRSRDPGSHLEPTKRVLVWRRFHDLITFRGWRDELKDGRYRCWDDEQEPVRNVPVRLDERLGCMVADWKAARGALRDPYQSDSGFLSGPSLSGAIDSIFIPGGTFDRSGQGDCAGAGPLPGVETILVSDCGQRPGRRGQRSHR